MVVWNQARQVGVGTLVVVASLVLTSCTQTREQLVVADAIETVGPSLPPVAPPSEVSKCDGGMNVPGGADPWGGCWPGPGNTGVPNESTLQVRTGDFTITQPGYILEDTDVRGCISIAAGADNVVIRNVRVKADCSVLILNDAGAVGLRIIDTELDGNRFNKSDSAVSGAGYLLERVNIHGVGDGVKVGSGVAVKDSFIHDLNVSEDSHNDAIQSLDATGLTIDHNTVVADEGATSCIILSQNSGSDWQMRDVEISRNLLAGGAYTIYGGYEAGKDDPLRASGIVISDNRISTAIFPRGGSFGPLTSIDPPVVSVSGNLWADGPDVGQLV